MYCSEEQARYDIKHFQGFTTSGTHPNFPLPSVTRLAAIVLRYILE
jgi:hypothetical protein